MKNRLLIIIGIIVLFLNSMTLFGTAFTRADLETEILSRLKLGTTLYKGDNAYYMEIDKEIADTNEISQLGNQFINPNFLHVEYYVKDIMTSYMKKRDQSVKEPELVKQGYKTYLNQNKKNLEPVFDFFALFLQSKGHTISDIVIPEKPSYTLTQLKAVAVKNIYPAEISDDGKVRYKICIAADGFVDSPEPNKALEAFTFNSIMDAFRADIPEIDFSKTLSNYASVVQQLKLSTDKETALKRAQGVFWALLFQEKNFDTFLLSVYNEKKDYLPFVITTEQ